ncbi:MAG: CBASS cGAMP-activated phospholipase [Solirubrobacterales bacterium]
MPETGELRVLSIDGGGIRGLIPALVLAEIEDRTGRPIAELFDLVAGTSTGGILAAGLTRRGEGGKPRWSARELARLYLDQGPEIFARPLLHRARTLFGLADPRYPAAPLQAALDRYLGPARLSETLTDLLLPAYDTQAREPYFFKTRKAKEQSGDRDAPLALAAYATSAAPTYFPAALLPKNGKEPERPLVDGGMYANNPALCAYVEARRHHLGDEDRPMLLVSLGTGQLTRPYPYEKVRGWGVAEWMVPGTPLIDVIFDGASDTVDYHLADLMGDDHVRLQTALTRAKDDLDDASEENLAALRAETAKLLRDEAPRIDALVSRLGGPAPDDPGV